MDYQEIKLNSVTYEVHRIFNGTCSAGELVSEQFAKRLAEKNTFDVSKKTVI